MGNGGVDVLGVLNGAIGDRLHATKNDLAIAMRIARGRPGPRTVVFVHGLMCTEHVWTFADGSDYGVLLERDVGLSPLFVRFNTGRSVAENGAELSLLLDRLTAAHPEIEELVLVGFSMGGLVVRSATEVGRAGRQRWPSLTTRAFYLGTPHLGSPWERAGRWVATLLRDVGGPFTLLAGELADLRSAGIKDLGDAACAMPLAPEIEHYFVAGAVDPWIASFLGDALVPLASSTNGICDRRGASVPARVKILPGLAHMTLARHPDVYAAIRGWCEGATS